jgi:hypothetical protein
MWKEVKWVGLSWTHIKLGFGVIEWVRLVRVVLG